MTRYPAKPHPASHEYPAHAASGAARRSTSLPNGCDVIDRPGWRSAIPRACPRGPFDPSIELAALRCIVGSLDAAPEIGWIRASVEQLVKCPERHD